MFSVYYIPAKTARLSHGCLETKLRSDIGGKIGSDRWDITGLTFQIWTAPACCRESVRGSDSIREGEIISSVSGISSNPPTHTS